jgi:hypothetical protein
VGEFSDYEKEVTVLPSGKDMPETRLSSGENQQAAGSRVLPIQDRSVSRVDKEQTVGQVLVISAQLPDKRAAFKNCPQWKRKQKILWVAVKKQTGRGKGRFKTRDLFADSRCSQAILEFLSNTDVGRRAGSGRAEEDAESDASRGEIWERGERQRGKERRQEILSRTGTW